MVNPPSLASLTTFRLGGPPLDFAEADGPQAAADAIRFWNSRSISWCALGGGSNILADDAPLPFAVLRAVPPPGPFSPEPLAPGLWRVPAGVPLDAVADWAVSVLGDPRWTFASGIPGTLGGAVVGNAGAFGDSLASVVEAAEILDADASPALLPASALAFSYRASALQTRPCFLHAVRLRAAAPASGAEAGAARARRDEILALRRAKHPDPAVLPTAGSFFKNLPPAPGSDRRTPAGALLDAVGAKTLSVGRARVFPLHANILVADPGATAADVAALASLLARRVLDSFSVPLAPEVRYWGPLPPPL
ncbi:MAG: FAD-binding protein [Kiritimatiellae bacterium]|nr:FAD-binding protein [Kiritimatiellia bacterium]